MTRSSRRWRRSSRSARAKQGAARTRVRVEDFRADRRRHAARVGSFRCHWRFGGPGNGLWGPERTTLTEQEFMALLTVEDVSGVLTTEVALTVSFSDLKAAAAGSDDPQLANIDSFYTRGFTDADRTKRMTFTLIEFDSESSAQNHFELVKSDTTGLEEMAPPIGGCFRPTGAQCPGPWQRPRLQKAGQGYPAAHFAAGRPAATGVSGGP